MLIFTRTLSTVGLEGVQGEESFPVEWWRMYQCEGEAGRCYDANHLFITSACSKQTEDSSHTSSLILIINSWLSLDIFLSGGHQI